MRIAFFTARWRRGSVRGPSLAPYILALSLLGLTQMAVANEQSAIGQVSGASADLDIPDLSCKSGVRDVKLTAESIRPGDNFYVEFRTRLSPAIISGHMYIVFGRLGEDGKPLTHQVVGLYPKGSILGVYGGSLAWVPANVKPSGPDCSGIGVIDAWRVSLSQEPYAVLLANIRERLAKPPLWNMFGYNCNHFAAELGAIAGLRRPTNFALPAFAYLPAYIRANPSRAK